MDIGLFAAGAPADVTWLRTIGPMAEERGFHSLWFSEHVLLFDEITSTSPFTGRQVLAPGESPTLDPFSCVAFAAATTSRIRLGTGICVLPQRQPIFLAKETATIDMLSQGRLDLGVGVGWVREEFEALQIPYEQRGRLTDRNLDILRTLWTDSVSHYEGAHYVLPDCRQYPKPVQNPVPVHIGGNSNRGLARVAAHAQGWYAFSLTPPEVSERLRLLDRLLDDRERSRSDITVSVCGYRSSVDLDEVKRYRDVGVDQVILFGPGSGDHLERTLDDWAVNIAEPAAGL